MLVDLQRKGMQVVIPDADSFRQKAKPAVEELFKTNGRSRPGRKSWPSRREERAMASFDEIREKERRVREFLRARASRAPPEAPGQFLLADRGRPQPRGNHDRVGGRLPADHRNREVRDCEQHRSTPDGRGGELEAQGYEIRSFPWYEEREAPCRRDRRRGGPGERCSFPRGRGLTEEIARLRYSLTAEEVAATGGWGSGSPRRSRRRWPRPSGARRNRRSSAGSATNSGRTGSIPSR